MTYYGSGGRDGDHGVVFRGYYINGAVWQWSIVCPIAPLIVERGIELISKCIFAFQGKNILVPVFILIIIDRDQVI